MSEETENNLTEVEVQELTVETMAGELLKLVVDELKAAPDVWPKLSQLQQGDVIDRAERRIRAIVEQAVHLIASEGRKVIVADLEQITIKDGYKAVMKVRGGDPNRHELADSVNQAVLIVVGNAEGYMGGTGDVQPEADQGELEYNEDSDAQDPLYPAAVEFVVAQQKVSVSLIQRHFKVGYNRAARLIEVMEENGAVSAMASNGTRTVLTPPDNKAA